MKGGISIHALRGEGDPYSPSFINKHDNFNPRPPWGGRQNVIRINFYTRIISIHALRGEGDLKYTVFLGQSFLFQSTPSVGRATPTPPRTHKFKLISIHALRGEGDRTKPLHPEPTQHFNPRPPWGGRHFALASCAHDLTFQSTPSVGRATQTQIITTNKTVFQSTPSVGRATKSKV